MNISANRPQNRGLSGKPNLTLWLRLRKLASASVLVLASIVGSPQTVHAQQTDVSPREQAAKKALQRHGEGKVLGVRKKKRADGSAYFEVKILTKGQVSIYEIDA
ncbi:MAG: hypothetical protein KTR32_24830 [Granulosicoccus sp.]|nr:hypothetical protein [Granulosicoccus sp.]